MGKLGSRGYSLIEVLLAVAVIGTLAAVAVPKVAHVLAVSRTQKVVADLTMLDAAVVMYETEHGKQPLGTDIAVLGDYVQQISRVRPPTGSKVILAGEETEVVAASYALAREDGSQRATLDGHTADDFLAEAGGGS